MTPPVLPLYHFTGHRRLRDLLARQVRSAASAPPGPPGRRAEPPRVAGGVPKVWWLNMATTIPSFILYSGLRVDGTDPKRVVI